MAILTVGRNQQYGTIAAAVAAAHNGDTVSVLAGTYVNDVATIHANITLIASGGPVVLLGTAPLASGGALLTVAATATVDGFVFANAHAADGTAAGLLQTAGALTVRNSLFTGNQTGLLSTAGATATVSVQASEFANNGNGTGVSANIAVGAIQSLSISGSYVHDAAGGDEVRSLAHATAVASSRIADNAAAAGPALNLPNGGTVSVQGSVLEKGASWAAAAVIRFGGGTAYANSSLSVSGNTVVADKPGALLVQNGTVASASVSANQLYGFSGSAVSGLATVSGNTVPVARPAVSTAALIPWTATGTVAQAVPAPAATTAAAAERGVLVLDVSGTAYQGNPQFQVYVDGVQTGGTLTATASHAAGQSQRFTVAGTFAPGPHTVQVRFTNALAGASGAGRTLSLDGAQFNGASVGQPVTLRANGTTTLYTGTVAPAPTAVTVNLSENAWHGDAQALVTVDGKVQGIQTVTAPHASGQTEPMRFLVPLAPGAHTLGVSFLNGLSGPAGNRNLYVDSLDVAGQHYGAAAATLLTGGTSNFAFTVAPPSTGANANLFVTAGTAQAASLIVPAS